MAEINVVAVLSNVHQEEDDDEEALSLSDLPLVNHNSRILIEKQEDEDNSTQVLEDFDFSCSLSKESDMCVADEVFFQGQIMPLRHSVSSEKGLSLQYCGSGGGGRCSSRSESMDCSSTGLISSRSSSISSSHQSSSSSSGSSASPAKHKPQKLSPSPPPSPPPQNHFHSHPSPSPKVLNFHRRGISSRNCAKKSSVWNIFRIGLVTSPPEIAFHDLRTRCPNGRNHNNSGSRNSNASSGSAGKIEPECRKKKSISLFGGCNCSIDAVETVDSRAVNVKQSGIESGIEEENENGEPVKLQKQQAAKKHSSHHRTFEWLKQLSIEGSADDS